MKKQQNTEKIGSGLSFLPKESGTKHNLRRERETWSPELWVSSTERDLGFRKERDREIDWVFSLAQQKYADCRDYRNLPKRFEDGSSGIIRRRLSVYVTRYTELLKRWPLKMSLCMIFLTIHVWYESFHFSSIRKSVGFFFFFFFLQFCSKSCISNFF